jgi:hypothetical protein
LLYEYENFKYVNQDNKGILYKDGRILFIGNSWSGIMQFLQYTDNAQVVRDMFKAQLEQREVIKLRAEAKKPKDPELPVVQEPKKKPVLRRPSIDRRFV